MKRPFITFILFNLLITYTLGQNRINISEADSIRNLGNSFYNTNPEKCKKLLESAAQLYGNSGNKKEQATCYQNIAFAYGEKLDNAIEAINYVNKAISLWEEIKQPLQMANLLKYKGMLQGKLGKFAQGKESITKSVNLFSINGYEPGIAVAYFDLALIFESEKQHDSCIYYLNKNKVYFESVNDTFRIFNTNNKIIENFIELEKLDSAFKIYKSNSKLENSSKVYWQHLLDYYRISMKYFDLVNSNEMYSKYEEKYNLLSKTLMNKGVIAK